MSFMLAGMRALVSRALGLGVVMLLWGLVLPTCLFALGDATTGEACPNEGSPGFRTYLPVCRGYELVSPPFEDGLELANFEVAEDGDRMLVNSLGVFARSKSDTETHGGEYELVRTPEGWTVAAVSPPASSFPAQAMLAASPDLTKTLWRARGPSESVAAENFYVREANGRMVKLGSVLPPSVVAGPPAGNAETFQYLGSTKYLDASANLSHVLFGMLFPARSGLGWPGDTTLGESSLYEYSPGDVRPELVGVSDGRPMNEKEGVSAPVPAGQLISDCGTRLGAPSDLYNAVSASGETVFFTAVGHNAGGCHASFAAPAVSEVYARLGGLETVGVSEPSALECSACDTASKLPAEFAGASEDGSKVFFLTEQELLPGGGGVGLYEYDFDTPKEVHVIRVSAGSGPSEVQGVARVSEDGSHVYFVAKGVLTATGTGTLTEESPVVEEVATKTGVFAPGEQVTGAGVPAGTRIVAVHGETLELSAAATASGPGVELTVVNGENHVPSAGANNLYVSERDAAYPAGRLAFIATLSSETKAELEAQEAVACATLPEPEREECQERLEREYNHRNEADQGDWSPNDQRPVQATPDGQFLVFRSAADLTMGDHAPEADPQLFEYDAEREELAWVSRGASDYQPQGNESAEDHEAKVHKRAYGNGASPGQGGLAVSSDGGMVLFESTAALTARAVTASDAEVESVYVYESNVGEAGGSLADGDVYLISDGVSALGSSTVGLDESGQDALFNTADPLVPQDVDTQFDVYDARVDGGFPAPDPQPECASGCGAGGLAAPVFGAPASQSTGEVAPAPGSTPGAAKGSGGRETAAQLRAAGLARALRACRAGGRGRRRRACEARARKRYGVAVRAKKSAKSGRGGK